MSSPKSIFYFIFYFFCFRSMNDVHSIKRMEKGTYLIQKSFRDIPWKFIFCPINVNDDSHGCATCTLDIYIARNCISWINCCLSQIAFLLNSSFLEQWILIVCYSITCNNLDLIGGGTIVSCCSWCCRRITMIRAIAIITAVSISSRAIGICITVWIWISIVSRVRMSCLCRISSTCRSKSLTNTS